MVRAATWKLGSRHLRLARRVDGERKPRLRAAGGAEMEWQAGIGGHDADDLVRFAGDAEVAADDGGIGAETPLPERVAEYHHARAVRPVLVSGEAPAQHRPHAQNREEVGVHISDPNA